MVKFAVGLVIGFFLGAAAILYADGFADWVKSYLSIGS